MKILKNIIKIIIIIIISFFIINFISEINNYYVPEYEKINLEKILSNEITEDEYIILKKQTGLSKTLIDEIMEKDNYLEILTEFQEQNFTKYNVKCEYMFFPTTKSESLKDNNGKNIKLKIPELKNGDIIFTKSTHTLLFRHGHVAIVTDANKNELLESFMIGVNSDYSDIKYWTNYPTLAILRPKNLTEEEINNTVEYAKNNLYDIKYDLLTGIFEEKYIENTDKTHCSHLVWNAYKYAGIDIDSNGGKIVLPNDIFKNNELEIIWSYGLKIN